MKKLSKVLTLGTMVLAVTATSITAMAASQYSSPAAAAAGVTGQTIESVVAQKAENGTSYGEIANEFGKLTEFKAEVLEIKKDRLTERVANGTMTQEKADEIVAALEENQANCDGTGSAKIGKEQGAGFGGSNSNGQSQRKGMRGQGNGGCSVQAQ